MEVQPGIVEVTNGWQGFKEINTVLYVSDLMSVGDMVRILIQAHTYRGTAEKH